MFEPSNYIDQISNFFTYREIENNNNPYFYLLTETDYIGFPYLPKEVEYGLSVDYGRIKKLIGSTEDLQYLGNKVKELSINNVIISSRKNKKTWENLIDKLKSIMFNDKSISVFLDNRLLGSYYLEDLKIIENGWINGYPCKGLLSFQFVENTESIINSSFESIKDINIKSIKELRKNVFSVEKNIVVSDTSKTISNNNSLNVIASQNYNNFSYWREINDLNPEYNLFDPNQEFDNLKIPDKLKIVKNVVKNVNELISSNINWLL